MKKPVFLLHNGLKTTLLAVLLAVTFGFSASGQSIAEFKQTFSRASTAQEFSAEFGKMVDVFHEGKLNFKDEDVKDIVAYAQSKSFADIILPQVYGWAGSMYGDGRMHEAVQYFMESANLYARQHKLKSEALCYFEIALVQHKAENFAEAEEYYTKALTTGSDSLDHRTRINCYNGLALIQRESKNYDVAENDFRKAHEIALKNKDDAWVAILTGNIGSIHLRKKAYDSALYYYQKNLALVKNTPEIENEIETYAHIAKVYLGLKDPGQALKYLDSASNIVEKKKITLNDFFNPLDYINESYAQAHAALGDHKKAFDYYTRFHQVAQEKQSRVNSRSLRQLQLTYSFDQKKSEVELLKKVNEANIATIQQQRYLEYTFFFVMLLVSAFAFVTWKTGRQRKKLNKDLAKSNAELERLNKLKNKLFSVISHDLRTPLGNLQSILGLYSSGDLKAEDVATVAGKLGHQVKASGHVLENLLEWAKSELNEVRSNPTDFALLDIVDRVIHQFDSDLKTKNITASNNVPASIRVWADQNQVEIVLRNLLANAIKFTANEGTVTIAATTYTSTVQIMVKDSGVGMTPDQLNKLFNAETTVTTLGTNKEKGSSIGLLITQELIVNNFGSIGVESEKNSGTTFMITLPAREIQPPGNKK